MDDRIEPTPTAEPDPVAGSPPQTDPEPAGLAPATGAPVQAGSGASDDPPVSDETGDAWKETPEAVAFSQRIAAARKRIADFDAVALDPDLPVSVAMAATIALSERGPEIAYQLGRDRQLAERIAGLDPLSAARELGRIEAQLTAATRRTVTEAPPPLRSLGSGETPSRDPDAMSYQEYRAWRRTG